MPGPQLKTWAVKPLQGLELEPVLSECAARNITVGIIEAPDACPSV